MGMIKNALVVVLAAFGLPYVYKRFLTIRAIDPTYIAARYTAGILPSYTFEEGEFFGADGAPESIQAIRKAGFEKLASDFEMGAQGKAMEAKMADGLSDIRFTDTNRVPFPFQKIVREKLKVASIVVSSSGPVLTDVDGNEMIDVSGSYGVNVVGYDGYKGFIEKGWDRIKDLGPNVLGPVHPVINDVIKPLREITGLDEVSFHMSGTEAVMAAVRLARFNTKRRLVVTFGGAYHGWWDGMQPGPGNERFTSDVLAIKDMNEASMAMIKARASEIAAVLISPLQGLNPGKPPPSDLVLMDSAMRKTNDRIQAYTDWLHRLRKVTEEVGIALIFDEVYTGFRMGQHGATEYYGMGPDSGLKPDMIVYGKTLGGGMPVGVVCGKRELMHRFDKKHPLRVNYIIGTFSAAPMTLGAMAEFLEWNAENKALYEKGQTKTEEFILSCNKEFIDQGLPMRVDHLTTVWTVLFSQPGRYHWMYQYYLRAEGLALSWVGTGRCLFSLDFTDEQYEEVKAALLRAGKRMQEDGWWWDGNAEGETNLTAGVIKQKMGIEMVSKMVGIRK